MTRRRMGGSSDAWELFLQARKRLLDAWTLEGVPEDIQLRSLQVDAEQLAGIRGWVRAGHDKQLFIERLADDLDAARAERQARLDVLLKDPDQLLEVLLVDGCCPLDGFTLARRRRQDLPPEAGLSELYCRCGFTFGLG